MPQKAPATAWSIVAMTFSSLSRRWKTRLPAKSVSNLIFHPCSCHANGGPVYKMVGVMPLAFLSGTEILFAIVIGLLLFGGQLPELIKDVGKVLFKTKRSLEKMRRESGIEDAIRDI